ncbi:MULTISPECIES: hypothetical protein [Paenibacillus]|jgi:hypothetical protein|uniref:Uncharacterized protein n=2 Tax=Paenibacillus barengoltzii TaxID=343517 RepID=R9LA94_9BACL|nr:MULTISPECIES: hypothetical protein [Paenibacillus]EOS55699.1 hypothetical protein C812_02831 [Paenibacillus barengoltzii G22]MDU0331994.1 hypothetical protein [Paenibacillus sp. 3LSP]MEC2345756.1 hypothetical protein [Paenibacillus barengoltzii]SME98739.1 hypothetical protein SAMN02744102_00742 [Paenibacillus barengoltzii]SMF02536.1 hypothetical protein SAMN02744124_00908 [Paenibacillus barengoltzii J12]
MYLNNLDIAKQHIRDLSQELDRCLLAEQIRRREREKPKNERTKVPIGFNSVLVTILTRMRKRL